MTCSSTRLSTAFRWAWPYLEVWPAGALGDRLPPSINFVWAGLALGGVFLLGGGGFDRLDPLGAAFALGCGRGGRRTSSSAPAPAAASRRPTVWPGRWWSPQCCHCRWASWNR